MDNYKFPIVNFHGQLKIFNFHCKLSVRNYGAYAFVQRNCTAGFSVFPFQTRRKLSISLIICSMVDFSVFLFTKYGNAVGIPLITCSWMYTVCHFKAWGKDIIDSTVCMLNNTPYQANFGLSEN